MSGLAPIEEVVLGYTGASTIQQACTRLVNEYCGSARSGNRSELTRIARRLGIQSIERQSLPCDGLLIQTELGYIVKLNTNTSHKRQRFSLAHEIGHAILHQVEPNTRTVEARGLLLPKDHKSEERICDLIAAEILMPECAVRHIYRPNGHMIGEIVRLSSLFSTSLTAMIRRLKELRLVGDCCAFIVGLENTQAAISRILVNFSSRRLIAGRPWRIRDTHPIARATDSKSAVEGYGWINDARYRRQLYLEALQRVEGRAILVVARRNQDKAAIAYR